jgi:hypothetical protein
MYTETITVLNELISISEQLAMDYFRDRSLRGTEEKSYLYIMKVLDDAHRQIGKLKTARDVNKSGLLSK